MISRCLIMTQIHPVAILCVTSAHHGAHKMTWHPVPFVLRCMHGCVHIRSLRSGVGVSVLCMLHKTATRQPVDRKAPRPRNTHPPLSATLDFRGCHTSITRSSSNRENVCQQTITLKVQGVVFWRARQSHSALLMQSTRCTSSMPC